MSEFFTDADIEAGKTKKGGWTYAQLRKWGVSCPPKTGWKEQVKATRKSDLVVVYERLQQQKRNYALSNNSLLLVAPTPLSICPLCKQWIYLEMKEAWLGND